MELIFRLLRPKLSGEREVTYSDQVVVVKMKVIGMHWIGLGVVRAQPRFLLSSPLPTWASFTLVMSFCTWAHLHKLYTV